jgi:type VI secretion system protein VasG
MLAPDPEVLAESIRGELRKHFADALLGRLTLVPFYPLTSETLAAVIGLKLARIQRRFRENHDVELTWDAAVLKHIGDRCTAIETGGRMVDALITNTLLPELSQEVLSRLLQNRPMLTARIAITDGRFAYEFT